MKIAHVITGLHTGGAETMLCKLLSRMDRTRFDPIVVSLGDNGPVGLRISELDIPVFSCGMRPGIPNPRAVLNLLRPLRNFQPDLVQGWMYHGNLAAQMAAAVLSARTRVIWGVWNGGLSSHKLTTAMTIWLGARLSNLPARIVTDSVATAEVHQQRLRFGTGRWEVIPNGFDLDQFQPSEQARSEVRAELLLRPDAFLVGLIGRYHPVKDHSGFLEAAAIFRQRMPEAQFLLAGRGVGSNSVLIRQARDLGLSGSVHLLHERADVARITAALDIAVSASYSESLPNIIGEAMACGVPCVVTDVGDSAWLVGNTGIVVSPRNPAALADALGNLVGRESKGRRILGLAARQRITEGFSIAAIAVRFERLYERVLESSVARGGDRQCAA